MLTEEIKSHCEGIVSATKAADLVHLLLLFPLWFELKQLILKVGLFIKALQGLGFGVISGVQSNSDIMQ